MKMNDFIMTKKPGYRILRHVLFWIVIYIPSIGISCLSFLNYDLSHWPSWTKIFGWQIVYFSYFVVDIAFTYILAYYLLPRYFSRKKFGAFSLRVILLIFAAFIVSGIFIMGQFDDFRKNFVLSLWKHFQVFLNSGPVIRCALVLFAKELKNYYLYVEERISLVKENGEAELQLLKAQVHPHFLFNTLNNIYSFSLTRSPLAGHLLDKLSATLKYMITDCEAPVVSLEKEIKMLKNYISLEKVRYGNQLHLEVEWPEGTEKIMIAPLLLIPFVENSFKHGTSKMLKHPWIRLQVTIRENELYFYLSNSKPAGVNALTCKGGIGLKNVAKRLDLIYPNEHTLKIGETNNSFTVEMRIPIFAEGREVNIDQRPEKVNASLINLSHV